MGNSNTQEHYMEGYERLAAAVVRQAVDDYKSALTRLKRKPHDKEAQRMVSDCERFFRRDMGMYSDLDGESIIRAIRERVNYGK